MMVLVASHSHVITNWDVWSTATIVIYFFIGVDAFMAAWKLPWGITKALFLSFVGIFWMCALTGYAPLVFPNWPDDLTEATHRMLPVVSLLFLLCGGFNSIVVGLIAVDPNDVKQEGRKHV